MGLRKLFYISTSTGAHREVDGSLDQICAVSKVLNEQHEISGALLYSGEYFAQILEGEEVAVRAIMSRIMLDDRHKDIVVLVDEALSKRTYTGWTLAFARRSAFVNEQLAAALCNAAQRPSRIRNLERFMSGMVDA